MLCCNYCIACFLGAFLLRNRSDQIQTNRYACNLSAVILDDNY